MLASDFVSLAIAFLYVAALIALAEILRRVFCVPVDITRKIVHIGVGMGALVITSFFRTWFIAIIGPLVFIVVNWVSYRANIFHGIETGERRQFGTIFFPLSFVILVPSLWSRPTVLAASFMPLTWGDAAAAILGQRFGSHRFTLFGQASSVEGSLAMFAASFVATCFALLAFGQPIATSALISTAVALPATFAEALSPMGIDNLTVPLISALTLFALSGFLK